MRPPVRQRGVAVVTALLLTTLAITDDVLVMVVAVSRHQEGQREAVQLMRG